MKELVSPTRNWHSMKKEEVLQTLQSSEQGLSVVEVKRRLDEYGPNVLREEKKRRLLQLFLDQIKDAFVILLLVASVMSYIIGEMADAIMIVLIVVIVVVIGFIQEYRSEKALEALKKLTAPTARLMRDGATLTVPSSEVVPGDIILLEAGDRVPADARLLNIASLRTDEAPLTGESSPVEKSIAVIDENVPVADQKNSVFMGTHTVFGRAQAVVTSTGMNTEFGKIAGAVQAMDEKKTPLSIKLDVFAKKLGIIIVGLCGIIFLLEIVEHGVGIEAVIEGFMTAIALAVSAVPEALPALVIVTLALGTRDLAGRNAIIRRLASAETLGSTTVICADKTGTLSRGEMTVRKLYINNQIVDVSGIGYEPKGEFHASNLLINPQEDMPLTLLLRIGALCNDSNYDGKTIRGDSTEGALIVVAVKAQMNESVLRAQYPRVDELPFSSERKLMTTIHSTPKGRKIAYVKGAPEVIIKKCTHIIEDNTVNKLTADKKNEVLKNNEKLASQAFRMLGMAYKDLPDNLQDFTEKIVENNLVFVGLEAMIDPPREEAAKAIAMCKQAGIRNVMITGDHKLTAIAIAKELGMMDDKHNIALTGAELEKLSDEEYDKIVDDVVVYARVSPMHKLKIVEALKTKGEIVAMTGDGVNDAPALKRADIGVAMGITGTDVSKEAADMILADDNYATLVNAVERGRSIYDNIRKYIRFLLSCNFDELLVIGAWTIAGFPLPLLPIQILFINLVTDGPPAIALSVDPPAKDVMKRPPRNPKAGIFHGMFVFMLVSFLVQSVGSSICFAYGMFILNDYTKATTMTFLQVAFFELFVLWNCRSETKSVWRLGRDNLKNKSFVLSVVACFILTLCLPYIPILSSAFHIVPLTITELGLVFSLSSLGLFILPELLFGKKFLRWT
ncbi:MAG: cation-translocating P-type ATPase [Candidatus Bathyarchaeia archaeon]